MPAGEICFAMKCAYVVNKNPNSCLKQIRLSAYLSKILNKYNYLTYFYNKLTSFNYYRFRYQSEILSLAVGDDSIRPNAE